MIDFLRQNLLDFQYPAARRTALIAMLVTAFLSPDIGPSAPFPAIRLEQLFLAALLPSLFLFYRAHPALRRPMFTDYAFLALAAAITLSAAIAPLIVSQSTYSLRDPFEPARVIEYWLLFRLAFIAPPDTLSGRRVITLLGVAAVALGLFGVVQYLNLGSFNSIVTDIWADEHNLEGVTRRSRVVGFTGNANYFGILSALLMVTLLSLVLLRAPLSARARWLVVAAVFFATLSVVMSQSRTAVFAILGAMFLGILLVAVTWRGRADYLRTIGLFVAAVTISVTFVELVPPEFGTFHDRFSPQTLSSDDSVGIRFSRWRALLAGFFDDPPGYCEGNNLDDKIGKGHAPSGDVGAPAAASDALARDAQRKRDVRALSRGVLDYFCETDRWPYVEPSLAAALVPAFMDAIPTDPATGAPYESFVYRSGFIVGAALENPDDSEGPTFALGTVPNLVLNPSFDDRAGTPGSWSTSGREGRRPTARIETADDGLFGSRSAHVHLGPEEAVYQSVVYDFPRGEGWTASLWAKSTSGNEETLKLYLIALLVEGGEIDPLASRDVTLPANGEWVPVSLGFTTTESSRTFVMQYTVRPATLGASLDIALDAATLNPGTFVPSFPWVTDVDPARLRLTDAPTFADSPIVGVGPRKEFPTGSFDNEYALMLHRYGTVGLLAYMALFGSAFVIAWRARASALWPIVVLSFVLMVFVTALWAFNIAAGSYYHFQIMAIYWMLLGLLARARPQPGAAAPEPA
ncbi:MAG: O-antigen ligase family protein [Tepidiformaceae bacterium]